MKKDTARLIVTRDCPRSCVGCCNDQYNFDGDVPQLQHNDCMLTLNDYKTVVISGGEPLLLGEKLMPFLVALKFLGKKTVLYTSCVQDMPNKPTHDIFQLIDGVTFSMHAENPADAISELENFQYFVQRHNIQRDFRLCIDDRIEYCQSLH